MATTHETEQEKEVFEVVRKSEAAVLDAARKWAKAVGDAMPVEMPVAREVVNGVFNFTEQVLKAQLEFSHSIFRATKPGATPQHRATRVTSARKTPQRPSPTHKVA